MKVLLVLLLFLHGLIHLIGFAKAFHFGNITQLKFEISKPIGLLWLLSALLFISSGFLLFLSNNVWLLTAIIALLLSQFLIFKSWKDAKYGALINFTILIAVILSYGSYRFENEYINDVKANLKSSKNFTPELLTEADLKPLPLPVQKYLRYCGVVNKPKIKSMKVVFEGEMRDKGKDYFSFRSEQYNFFEKPTRLFFMKAKMFGITVPGYHKYSDAKAAMNIKLFGIFPIVSQSGSVMNQTETVTLFNDMCLLAPATLIDKIIKWELIDNKSVKAIFINNKIKVTAKLYFNDKGQLANFISNDRTAVADGKKYPFSTPVLSYKNNNGFRLMSSGEAVWRYPDGKFTYGKFHLKKIHYNLD
ncbi:hypothetical protein LZZ90_09060 [Flavobacterium sp. SM15]|uniref:DUF6544 family protein n=1 Tax=Flavobacterium sp. SM15 TaxID=2908005 RepID=UPI001EDBB581|nr:DUF6544 family protein [Flavobacterium sp. SM15]MCG2611654.1 hypothetical protein [Flavobacterium sp. SM15]